MIAGETKKTWAECMEGLEDTFRRWGVTNWMPQPMKAKTGDRKVIVNFERQGNPVRLECEVHQEARNNLFTIWQAIDSMRLNEARGLGQVLSSAYLQLTPPPVDGPWWAVLGIPATKDREAIEAAYRRKAQTEHPDKGGTAERFKRLAGAREKALATL